MDSTPEAPLSHDLDQLLAVAVDAARRAGQMIHERVRDRHDIRFKEGGAYNIVTEMDTASEELIQRIIHAYDPNACFLAEESGGYEEMKKPTWVIDPIDGTVNYAHGIPIYAISIGLVVEGEPVLGVIFDPNRNELFTAVRGRGAWLNGEPMRASETATLNRSVLVTGFPYNVAENPSGCIDAFVHLLKQGIPIRRLGSAALDLAYVAAGRFDGFWEVSLGRWDVAAGVLMIVEAGGTVGTYGDDAPSGILITNRILATNGKVHKELEGVLREAASVRSEK